LVKEKMKLSVIFPVYNEKATIAQVLDELIAFNMEGLETEIIVVEGNSTDGTREIVKSYEDRPNVRIFYEDVPKGKGAAVRTGLAEVRGDIVLIQDGDLEYKISDYPKVLAPIIEGKADIVFGSRALDPGTHWQYRKFHGLENIYGFFVNIGGVFFTTLFNILYGTKLSDGATMFKVYRASILEGLVLFAILWVFSKKERPYMSVSGLFLQFYGIFRFSVEFVRVPDQDIGYLAADWVTMGHVLTTPMILAGATLLYFAYRRPA